MRKLTVILGVISGLAQSTKNLQYRPNGKMKLNSEKVRQYENEVMSQIADLALIQPENNTSPFPEYDSQT